LRRQSKLHPYRRWEYPLRNQNFKCQNPCLRQAGKY